MEYKVNRVEELYHFGIKGMKWGVRRYRNTDGTLTKAGKKRLQKEIIDEYKNTVSSGKVYYKLSESKSAEVRNELSKIVTDSDKKRLRESYNAWEKSMRESQKAEKQLTGIVKKYADEYYNDEIKRNPDLYKTSRSKRALKDFAAEEYGYDKAFKQHPELEKTINSSDEKWKNYLNECYSVGDKLLGRYGKKNLHKSKYTSLSIRTLVRSEVMSMKID